MNTTLDRVCRNVDTEMLHELAIDHEDFLDDFVFGRLPENLDRAIRSHLCTCAVCSDFVGETILLVTALREEASPEKPCGTH